MKINVLTSSATKNMVISLFFLHFGTNFVEKRRHSGKNFILCVTIPQQTVKALLASEASNFRIFDEYRNDSFDNLCLLSWT